MHRGRMHGATEFRRERRVNHAVALDPALPFEGRRYNIHPEVRLTAGSVAGMALMKMRFVSNLEAFGEERFAQLVCDSVPGAHGGGIKSADLFRQWRCRRSGIRNVKT